MNNLNLDYKLNTLYEKLENNNNHKDLKLLWKNIHMLDLFELRHFAAEGMWRRRPFSRQ